MAGVEKGRHEWNWEISRKEMHKTLVHGCDERRKGMLRKTEELACAIYTGRNP